MSSIPQPDEPEVNETVRRGVQLLDILQGLAPDTRQQVGALREVPVSPAAVSAWYLVVVPDSGPPTVECFSDTTGITNRLVTLEGQDVNCFVFYGLRAAITKKPFRYLVLPGGQAYPLFLLPGVGDTEQTGFLGEVVEIGRTPEPSAEELEDEYEVVEEEFDEEDEDVADEEPEDS